MSFSTIFAISLINVLGILIYAISSFGNAILFHIGWQVCFSFAPNVCNGLVTDAVVYITMSVFFSFPIQCYLLRDHINWLLCIHLVCSQQIGMAIGVYLLFAFSSPWIARGLGIGFMFVAVEKIVSEAKLFAKQKHNQTEHCITSKNPLQAAVNGSDPIKIDSNTNDNDIAEADTISSSIVASSEVHGVHYSLDSQKKYCIVWFCGFTSGICSGLFSTGGPPLMLFVTYYNIEQKETKSTLGVCFVIGNYFRAMVIMAFQSSVNVYTNSMYIIFAILSLSSIALLFIGNKIASQVNQDTFRRIVLLLLVAGAALLLASGCTLTIKLVLLCTCIVFVCTIGWICYIKECKQITYMELIHLLMNNPREMWNTNVPANTTNYQTIDKFISTVNVHNSYNISSIGSSGGQYGMHITDNSTTNPILPLEIDKTYGASYCMK